MTVAVWVGLRGQGPVDGDRARRRPGGRRHLPGGDLPRLHDGLARDARRAPRRSPARDDGVRPRPPACRPRQTVDPNAVPDAEQPTRDGARTRATAAARQRPARRRARARDAAARRRPRRRRRRDDARADPTQPPDRRRGHRRRRRRRNGTDALGGARGASARGQGRDTCAAVGVAEAPRQVGRLGDADPLPDDDPRLPAPGSRSRTSIGPSSSELPFSDSPIPSAWVSLPGPSRGRSVALHAAPPRASPRCRRPARARGSAPPRRPPPPRTPR